MTTSGGIFQEACRRLGHAPARVPHVGDSPAEDAVGAKRAGPRSRLVNRRGRKVPEGPAAPDAVLPSLEGLPGRPPRREKRV